MSKSQGNSSTTNKPDSLGPNPRPILKTSFCRALSSKSEIGYELSLDEKKAFYIRLTSNSGGGYFSDESISLAEIERILFSQTDPSRLTSVALQALFKGKSVNTPAFLMAVLRDLGFVKSIGELKRFHQLIDAKSFKVLQKKLQKLAISSTTGQ